MGFGASFLTDPAGARVASRLHQHLEGSSDPSVSISVSVQQTQLPCWLTGTGRVVAGVGAQSGEEGRGAFLPPIFGRLALSFTRAWPTTTTPTK